MREAVTISLPQNIKAELDNVMSEQGLSRSDIMRQALQDYLFSYQFKRLQARMVSQAQAQGIFTDEDVFDKLQSK